LISPASPNPAKVHKPSEGTTGKLLGTGEIMQSVLLALLPALLVYAVLLSPGILYQVVICCVTAIIVEVMVQRLRKRPVVLTLKDNSALVCAVLLAFALPALSPWWVAVCGTSVALLLGKHLYGGLGHNPFNPAMVGYAFLIVTFPVEMTAWPTPHLGNPDNAPGLLDAMAIVFGFQDLLHPSWDAITSATPLDRLKHEIDASTPAHGIVGAYGWEWVNAAWLAGGVWLLWRRIISWQIPVFFCLALTLGYGLGYLLDLNQTLVETSAVTTAGPLFALFSGSAMLGAFFIATDPVSAATTSLGRVIYAAGIGFLVWLIREFSHYPEGLAFAVLLMNLCAPLIDHYCRNTGMSWRWLR